MSSYFVYDLPDKSTKDIRELAKLAVERGSPNDVMRLKDGYAYITKDKLIAVHISRGYKRNWRAWDDGRKIIKFINKSKHAKAVPLPKAGSMTNPLNIETGQPTIPLNSGEEEEEDIFQPLGEEGTPATLGEEEENREEESEEEHYNIEAGQRSHGSLFITLVFMIVLIAGILSLGLINYLISVVGVIFFIYAAGRYHKGGIPPKNISVNTLTKLYGAFTVNFIISDTGLLATFTLLAIPILIVVGIILTLMIPIIGSTVLYTMNSLFGYLPGSKFIFY